MPDVKSFADDVRADFEAKAAEMGVDVDDETPLSDDGGEFADDGGDNAASGEIQRITKPTGEPQLNGAQAPVSGDPATPVAQIQLPPHTWPAEWKETFNKLPPEAQALALRQNELMERGFQEKMGKLGRKGRELDSIERSVKPHLERLQRAGISPDVAIQRALGWDAYIAEHGPRGLVDMARAYGFDPAAMQPQREEVYLTPTERQMRQQLEEMQRKLDEFGQQSRDTTQQQQERWQREREDAVAGQLHAFMSETDPTSGQPKHPYLPHVQHVMARLINGRVATSLEEAYDMAVRLNPDIQAALERQAALTTGARKVDEVRAASNAGNIVSKTPVTPGKGSFEQTLRAEASRRRA